jgi:OOP family OmpA-OmpF porin
MLLIIAILLFKNNKAQNLIQNGSFEYSSSYNCNGDFINTSTAFPGYGFHMLNDWLPISSPDYYYNSCSPLGYGTPINRPGKEVPKDGVAYVGICVYYKPYETKEYIQQHLNFPLISGKSYYLSFYVSRVERFTMSIKNIGAYLSISQPTVAGNTYFSALPQIVNDTGFLTDTLGWSKIEGYFTAQGGEEYITIGNFNSNANTDTLYIGTNDPLPSNPDGAYYYIDSVSLYDSLDYALITNVKNLEDEIRVNVYPNPNNGNFKLEYHITKEAEFVITDITGRLVNQYALLPSQNSLLIKEEELNGGVYFYSIKINNSVLKNNKLIIIK